MDDIVVFSPTDRGQFSVKEVPSSKSNQNHYLSFIRGDIVGEAFETKQAAKDFLQMEYNKEKAEVARSR